MGILSRTSSDLTFQGSFIVVDLWLPQSGNAPPFHRRRKRSDICVDALKCAKYQRVCTLVAVTTKSYYLITTIITFYTDAQGSWYYGMSHLLLLVWMLIDLLPKYRALF